MVTVLIFPFSLFIYTIFITTTIMVPITEELIRKHAEHNDKQIYSLEELSLHQLGIEKIENIDKWCPHLQILYLHGNLISKIENVKKLKRLTYLNLTMNNIELIENLSGCESLTKLDLTVNFIRKLSSIAELKDNYNLREIYLTGNPCTAYKGYRMYVINTLPQVSSLDGTHIERSERIVASQNKEKVQVQILKQEEEKSSQEKSASSSDNEEDDITFWSRKTEHTPESRLKIHRKLESLKGESKSNVHQKNKNSVRKLTNKDGRILNINEPRVSFHFSDMNDSISLDVHVYKYLDTSLLSVDVEPTYIKITIKEKLLQLVLDEEVLPDQSTVQRSQTTGHLIIKMPKMKNVLVPVGKHPLNINNQMIADQQFLYKQIPELS